MSVYTLIILTIELSLILAFEISFSLIYLSFCATKMSDAYDNSLSWSCYGTCCWIEFWCWLPVFQRFDCLFLPCYSSGRTWNGGLSFVGYCCLPYTSGRHSCLLMVNVRVKNRHIVAHWFVQPNLLHWLGTSSVLYKLVHSFNSTCYLREYFPIHCI